MYAYIEGILTEKNNDSIVIDCGGIGFELKIPMTTLTGLPNINEIAKVYVYTFTNDEGTRLFGFLNKYEKELFKLLISVNRIGPKIALSILSYMGIDSLIKAIISGNTKIIAKTPGLGTKSAERLIIELKDKVEQISEIESEIIKNNVISGSRKSFVDRIWNEVEVALLSLGYKSHEVCDAMQNAAIESDMPSEKLLKNCIKYIYLKRNEA
ncbi:MAG: Holliday junction branch migration protein RuvA [Candidatus Cloacimonetes bacterium]|nr:Holliday junction branch migration protein RuvA [Candidatus Cloacimonadota bacterium]